MAKKKKVSSAFAIALAAGTIFSAPIYGYAAQKDDVHPSEKQEWAKEINNEKIKGQANQLRSIDKQVAGIEEKLGEYKQEIDSLNLETPAIGEEPQENTSVEATDKHEEYADKLTALENRLNAMNHRLDSLMVKGNATGDIQKREQRVEVLQIEVQTLIQTVVGEASEEENIETPAEGDAVETPVIEAPEAPVVDNAEGVVSTGG
ncbi:hypothetical protein [Bacillus sp. PK3_68]|uniref:hypothetical protein n=1 Tax=Bacillus sp. PK3_68 TaxID=2027408 RepID=UPI000E7565C3|nr:hypothetical protein [Bacillus sp. PK3_68]RJS60491.1 hypothetical protein CJ483_10755 [Bacillus sp. PK3_68]